MSDGKKFLATLRVTFDAEDEVEARMIGNEMQEALDRHVLEDDDTADVTQIIPMFMDDVVAPEEVVAQLERCRDLLITTRIIQCVDLARELDKIAWVLENRQEATFNMANYDYGAFEQRITDILGKRKRG